VKQKKALSSLLADIPPTVVTPEIRVDCPDDEKFLLVESVKKRLKNVVATQDFKKAALPIRDIITIDGIRVCFDEGWGLIRASNTQPALVLRFEASSHAHLTQIQAYMEGQLSEATADLIT
jgi:phosphomannomutase/phosphoglucomutase